MDQASQVREKIDIASFISEYIPLKKAGRNFKANCPFHNEKTPSFVVSPERQIWHCFGCQKGGDCFTFLMDYEHLEFIEALRILAKRTGVELKETFDNKTYSIKEKIFNLNKVSAKFYNYILVKHPAGKIALNYLTKERLMSLPLIETYQLGFSPTGGVALSNYLLSSKKGFKKQDLYEAGLTFERVGRVFDFFRNRIMFPLTDHRDNIVGFSGRILSDKQDGPKYINTKETLVYHKGDLFFGLSAAKEEIKKQEQAILVEGEFDVISCFKEGIKNVVAVKGTALTENQVALLSRFTKKVSLCLDQDNAGFEAIKRSLSVLEKKGLMTTVIIPNGKDPDEAIKKDPYAFKKSIKAEIPVYDFLITKALTEEDKKNALGKKKITDNLLPFFAEISNEVVKEHYLRKLSQEIDTSYESLIRETEKIQTGREKDVVVYPTKDKKTRREVLEEYFLAIVIQSDNPKAVLSKGLQVLGDYVFESTSYKKIIDQLEDFFKRQDGFDGKKFAQDLPKELLKSFDTCFLLPLPKFETNDKYYEEARKSASELLTFYVKDKIKELSEKIKIKEKENSPEAENLKKEIINLMSLLPKALKA